MIKLKSQNTGRARIVRKEHKLDEFPRITGWTHSPDSQEYQAALLTWEMEGRLFTMEIDKESGRQLIEGLLRLYEKPTD